MSGRQSASAPRLILSLSSWPLLSLALDVPPLTGRVVDLAHVLPPNTVESLTARPRSRTKTTTSNQVTVLVLPSLEERTARILLPSCRDDMEAGSEGNRQRSPAAWSPCKERKIRIEVGYGLEGALTDARSAQIIQQVRSSRGFVAGDAAGRGRRRGRRDSRRRLKEPIKASDKTAPGLDSDGHGARSWSACDCWINRRVWAVIECAIASSVPSPAQELSRIARRAVGVVALRLASAGGVSPLAAHVDQCDRCRRERPRTAWRGRLGLVTAVAVADGAAARSAVVGVVSAAAGGDFGGGGASGNW